MEKATAVKVRKNQVIVKQKDPVKRWYLILEGSVMQKNSYARVVLEKDSVIGISEGDRYLCDYIAMQDTVLAVFPYDSADTLSSIIRGQEGMRRILIRAALQQRELLLRNYTGFHKLAHQFHFFVENAYNNYTNFCIKYGLEEQSFQRIDSFKPLEMVHKAENWEVNNSTCLTDGYLEEYLQLMKKADSLCIGAIMEASRQMCRVTQGIIEMVEYLSYNRDILLSESGNDLFSLYFDLVCRAERTELDAGALLEQMNRMIDVIRVLNIYDGDLIASRIEEYRDRENIDFSVNENVKSESGVRESDRKIQRGGIGQDCLGQILTYAGYQREEQEEIDALVDQYRQLSDIFATDENTYQLRKSIAQMFYDVYYKVFMRAMEDEESLTPVAEMFLNFGFMDINLAGEENANLLYDLTEHLDVFQSGHTYTIYSWLKSIYDGTNEPSKNEFDLDYTGYLNEQRKAGKLSADEFKMHTGKNEFKVKYEIQNMFTAGNKATYGKISTFCPILCEHDFINSVEKMLVTAQKLEGALNKIREIDFSVFYRETQFADPNKGIQREMIMKEVLPDIILMPNAGTKAMMWQETSGVRRDTSARYMFPIFTSVDIDDMMIEITGRFRWEICRKVQGMRWNDIRERSLTSEYCDYIQFYRKNHELSSEAKEKVKSALLRGKNNYREVFVKDYENWMKYESKGSFRLNKVAREILLSYCPFAKSIRTNLKSNPMYQNSLQRLEQMNEKKVKRIRGLYEKYQKAGGVITEELQKNIDYYDL